MPSLKRPTPRANRPRSALKRPPASRRGREHWTVRWIGAAKRRAAKRVKTIPVEAPSARIIHLSWADTFGRPMRIVPARLLQFAAALEPSPSS